MAGVEGLEPSQAVLETDVLPLTLYPYMLSFLKTFIILAHFSIFDKYSGKIFLTIFLFFSIAFILNLCYKFYILVS